VDKGIVHFRHTLDWINGKPVAEENKSRSSRRSVLIPPYVVGVLRRHLADQAKQARSARTPNQDKGWADYGLVFTGERGQPLRGSTAYRRLHRLLAKHDLPVLRWHDLRHSAASIMLALGLPLHVVQRTIGHSSLVMLAQRYAHLVPELAAEEVKKLEDGLITLEDGVEAEIGRQAPPATHATTATRIAPTLPE
jgi:integrase